MHFWQPIWSGYIAGVAAYYDPGSYYAGVEYAEVKFDGDVVSLAGG